MCRAGLPCPRPLQVQDHVLVMQFIGSADGHAAPQLRELPPHVSSRQLRALLTQVITILRRLWQECSLVHGDLSEYNLLVDNDRHVWVIDVGQAVDRSHPRALTLLHRDVCNVLAWFQKRGVLVPVPFRCQAPSESTAGSGTGLNPANGIEAAVEETCTISTDDVVSRLVHFATFSPDDFEGADVSDVDTSDADTCEADTGVADAGDAADNKIVCDATSGSGAVDPGQKRDSTVRDNAAMAAADLVSELHDLCMGKRRGDCGRKEDDKGCGIGVGVAALQHHLRRVTTLGMVMAADYERQRAPAHSHVAATLALSTQ